eukprot:1221496-Rhodomonas_salina.1
MSELANTQQVHSHDPESISLQHIANEVLGVELLRGWNSDAKAQDQHDEDNQVQHQALNTAGHLWASQRRFQQ